MISCEIHDYVEIACMYKLSITVTFKTGEKLSGIASDTGYDANRAECIKLIVDNETRLLPLVDLESMTANRANPHFDVVKF